MASGMPSSRRQSSTTAAAFVASSAKLGRAAPTRGRRTAAPLRLVPAPSASSSVGSVERPARDQSLAGDAERLRGSWRAPGRRARSRASRRRAAAALVDQVLAVVEHQQQLASCAATSTTLSVDDVPAAACTPERRSDDVGDRVGVVHRRRDRTNHAPSGKRGSELGGDLQSRAASCRRRRRRSA